jgi:hypothetical protein
MKGSDASFLNIIGWISNPFRWLTAGATDAQIRLAKKRQLSNWSGMTHI